MQVDNIEQAKLQTTSYNYGQPPLVNYNQQLPQGYNPYTPVYAKQPFDGISIGVQPMQMVVMVQVDPLCQEELNIQREMRCSRTTFFVLLIILAFFDAFGIFG